MLGTLSVSDTLASAANQTVADFGEDNAFKEISRFLDAHNQVTGDMLASLCDFTDDRLRRYGGVDEMEMQEAGEYHTPEAQKVAAGATVGFPLRRQEIALQWTRDYFENHTVAELAAQFDAARAADLRRIQRELKRALFSSANYRFSDYLVDRVDIDVKRLLNADGQPVPINPQGETFNPATHTHYIARVGALANSDVQSAIEHVVEHGYGGRPVIYINRGNEAAIRALTGFNPYTEARIIPAPGGTADRASGTVATDTLYNKSIGIFDGGAEVWVKPWIPNNYLLVFDAASPAKPLVWRNRLGHGSARPAPLQIVAELELYPLRAQIMRREFGIGVWNRANGCVLYVGGTSYVVPTFN